MGFLSKVFPGWAYKRAVARAKLERVNALYQASRPDRTHPRRGDHLSANATMARTNASLRSFARYADENHDLAISVFDDLENWVVGTGISIEPMGKSGDQLAEDWNRQVKELWHEWWERPETTQELSGADVERLVARSVFRDGEVLVHHVNSARYPYPTPIPYALETLEADYLDFDMQRAKSEGRGRIIQGVEVDDWGRPVRYHLWRAHPGEEGWVYSMGRQRSGIKVINASNLSHIKFVRRLRQLRGVPIVHGVLRRMDDIKELEDAELTAARADADMFAFVRNIADFGETGENKRGEDQNQYESERGMMVHTFEGEDVDVHTPSRPNAQLEAFRAGQIQMVAAGTGTRESSISKNYDGTYSSQRQELVEGQMSYAKLRMTLIGAFYKPVYRRFIDSAVLSGQLSLRGVDRRTVYRADYRGPATPWIDPEKEINAQIKRVDGKLGSRQQAIRDLGNDPQTVFDQIERDPYGGETEEPAEPAENEATGLRAVQ